MHSTILENANAMPASTWQRMNVNDTVIAIPQELIEAHDISLETSKNVFGNSDAFDNAISSAQLVLDASNLAPYKTTAMIDEGKGEDILYGGTALSSYQAHADAVEEPRDIAKAFETGMGQEAFSFMREICDEPIVISADEGETLDCAIAVSGVDGAINVAAIDVVASKSSDVSLFLNVNSPMKGSGFTGTSLRVFAGENANVNIYRLQTLDDGWTDLDDMGLLSLESARINVRQNVFGGSSTFTGLAGDMRGANSRIDVDLNYLGHESQVHDFNYTLRHHGESSECNINANGVLANKSEKTFRGTIDFVRGCKGAIGQEKESVLLVDDDVINKTVPVILCNEDDVIGNHGASIGHVRPDQMLYLSSRGLSRDAAERMFLKAMLEKESIGAPNPQSKEDIAKFGEKIFGSFAETQNDETTDEQTPIINGVNIEENPYKNDFPLLVNNPEIAFLDNAATSQRPSLVLDAQREFYENMNANPLRGLYELSYRATEAVSETRKHIARFIGAGEENWHDVIFCRNTSEALNLLAHSLGEYALEEGDEVCVTVMEHHSNEIPWQLACKRAGAKLVYMYLDDEGRVTEDEMRAKIGPKTKIVSATHVSNVLGVENDVKRMGELAHENGALMIVDGAQSVPHFKVDVTDLNCDFFAFSAHKMFGPMGIGVLWGKHDILDAMPPFLTGGEMIDEVTEQDAVWAGVPEKFEAGTQDAAGAYALGAAMTYMENIGIDAIQSREAALVQYCIQELDKLDFVTIYGPKNPAEHHGVVSFNVKNVHPHDVSGILDTVHVAIRAGHHCAQPLMSQLGCQSNCRASMAFYNDKGDVDQLIEGLKLVWSMFNGI